MPATTDIGHWIDGKPCTGTSSVTAPVTDPATSRTTGQVRMAEVADV